MTMLSTILLYSESPPEPLDRGFDACGESDTPSDPFDLLLARLRQQAVSFNATWEMTHLCNLECVMCRNVPLAEPELSTDEGIELLEQMAAAGVLRLTLTGGEILTRRDFFTLTQRARSLGFALDLKTNATLITEAVADQLAALDPIQVDISLLGATGVTFDAVAGSRNTLPRVLRGVRLLQERDVRVKLNTLLLALNLAEREQMLCLAEELGVDYEQFFRISAGDDGVIKGASYQISRDEMRTVLEADDSPLRIRAAVPEARTCRVGMSSCLISPYGEVYPCVELRVSAGNIRRQAFADIWAEAPIFLELRGRHTMANLPECQVCPINAFCEGRCAGLAWKEHGDLYGGHSLACQHAQARYEQLNPGQKAPPTPVQTKFLTRGQASIPPPVALQSINGEKHSLPAFAA